MSTRELADEAVTRELFKYVQHAYNCDWLQPMWHKGPCDCGLTDLVKRLPEELRAMLVDVSDHVRATVEELTRREEREREEREAAQRLKQEMQP